MLLDAPIEKWVTIIPRLWVNVCRILEICEAEYQSSGEILAADDSKFRELLGLEVAKRNDGKEQAKKTRFINQYDSKSIHPIGQTDLDVKTSNPFFTELNKDRHLQLGMLYSSSREKRHARVVELSILAFSESKETVAARRSQTRSTFLPSPTYIVYQLLIEPENLCTAAYALYACREWLSSILQVHPVLGKSDNETSEPPFLLAHFDFENAMRSLSNHDKIAMPWPRHDDIPDEEQDLLAGDDVGGTPSSNQFIGHFLTIHGMVHLRFRKGAGSKFLHFGATHKLSSDALAKDIRRRLLLPQFKRANKYQRLPAKDEIANQLFGFPIPIQGVDVVFNGGLRPSADGGLVMSLSGAPGAGKTSFALALAKSMAPLGTVCKYVSFEESEEDIEKKLNSITPAYFSQLGITSGIGNSFECKKYDGAMTVSEFATAVQEKLSGFLTKEPNYSATRAGLCPGILVFDNLNELVVLNDPDVTEQKEAISALADLIDTCRKSQLIVVFISARDVPSKLRLDYLVDFMIDLSYQDLGEINNRPARVFNLVKSRHQEARHGSHLFHLGSGEGFRLVANMDSLIEKREILSRQLPDRTSVINTLNYDKNRMPINRRRIKETAPLIPYLKLFELSNILIHGHGSTGKAGLALKLLLTPPMNQNSITKKRRRVLIVSFLFPITYYEELRSQISSDIEKQFKEKDSTKIDEIVLYPGYIHPQDFLSKITSKLDQARLEGFPFTGVLIDGLHNVFLQYERLQNNNIVWAVLYSILARYNVTVVSTFTMFSISEPLNLEAGMSAASTGSSNDQSGMKERMTPLLHALVSATDFYVYLQEVKNKERDERRYLLEIQQAIGQPLPDEYLLWDREESKAIGKVSLKALRSWALGSGQLNLDLN